MGISGLQLLALELSPLDLDGVTCAAYHAVQVDRYVPDRLEIRHEYAHFGRLCRHPTAPGQWLQAFYTEAFERGSGLGPHISLAEANAFFQQWKIGVPP
jgi:hypothetical protein